MLRILSDLHFRDATSRLLRLEDLTALLEGVSELWLNGDTCDNQSGMTAVELNEIKDFFTDRVPHVRFITGNHDPDISADHEASAADGRIWACHGDAFLDDLVPWSRMRNKLVDRINEIRAAHPALGYESFEDRVRIMRMACIGFARECDPEQRNSWHLLRRICTEVLPPRQPWAMLHTWATFGTRAATAAAQWRPDAQVIISGHVHFPRVWRRGPRTVINTGAFTGPLGAYAVDYADEVVTVKRIQSRDGAWHAGRIISTIPLAS